MASHFLSIANTRPAFACSAASTATDPVPQPMSYTTLSGESRSFPTAAARTSAFVIGTSPRTKSPSGMHVRSGACIGCAFWTHRSAAPNVRRANAAQTSSVTRCCGVPNASATAARNWPKPWSDSSAHASFAASVCWSVYACVRTAASSALPGASGGSCAISCGGIPRCAANRSSGRTDGSGVTEKPSKRGISCAISRRPLPGSKRALAWAPASRTASAAFCGERPSRPRSMVFSQRASTSFARALIPPGPVPIK